MARVTSMPLRSEKPANIVAQRAGEAQRFQQRRVEQVGERANFAAGILEDGETVGNEVGNLGIGGGGQGLQFGQVHPHGHELLRGGIVQLAGDAPVFLILGAQELPGKVVQGFIGLPQFFLRAPAVR